MMKYNEELTRAGVLLAGEGLQPSSKGTRVKFSAGKQAVRNAPGLTIAKMNWSQTI